MALDRQFHAPEAAEGTTAPAVAAPVAPGSVAHGGPQRRTRIDDGARMLETLLARPQVAFQGRTARVPDQSGLYICSNWGTDDVLYVGRAMKSIQRRLRNHWDGAEPSDLARSLVVDQVVETVSEGRRWIKTNVAIHWMMDRELGICVRWAELFAIAVLRPTYNR